MDVSFLFYLAGAGLAGLCCGGIVMWLLMRNRLAEQRGLAEERVQLRESQRVDLERRLAAGEEERAGLRRENGALQARVAELAARLEVEQRQLQEKQALLQEARQEL
ncbi:MAG: DNA recombination protein RmuC, partial [Deltaproteobacteria bacterium HGW-Deltaproteobacteria-16]